MRKSNKILNEFTPMGLVVIVTTVIVLIGIIVIVAFIVMKGL